jgi:hypothetical protein
VACDGFARPSIQEGFWATTTALAKAFNEVPTPSNFKESQFSVAALAYFEKTRSPCRTIYPFHLRPHLPIEHYFQISCRRGAKKQLRKTIEN